ncbi:MAG: hypothetical protein Q4D88_06455 [Anaerococcus sp.]|nr:hypothetical protein [Anaerococcus sp.]
MGRCNREGKKEEGLCYLINLSKSAENISPMKSRVDGKKAFAYTIEKNKDVDDLTKLNDQYFDKLYANIKEEDLRFRIKDDNFLTLFSTNDPKVDLILKQNNENLSYKTYNDFILTDFDTPLGLFPSFKTAYRNFKLIDEKAKTVIVDDEDIREDLDRLRDLEEDFKRTYDTNILKEMSRIIRKLNRYSVPIKEDKLSYCENIMDGSIYILPSIYYDEELGIMDDFDGDFIL